MGFCDKHRLGGLSKRVEWQGEDPCPYCNKGSNAIHFLQVGDFIRHMEVPHTDKQIAWIYYPKANEYCIYGITDEAKNVLGDTCIFLKLPETPENDADVQAIVDQFDWLIGKVAITSKPRHISQH